MLKQRIGYLFISLCLFTVAVWLNRETVQQKTIPTDRPKVYWFIPDGFRADRDQFNIFEWADRGEMPNLKKLMEAGCFGYSWPVFPGHTPVNFATLMTGVMPEKHGIADGAMRQIGYPLNMIAAGGFSSFTKLVPSLWVQLEQKGFLVSLQSIPGSTPPELFNGNTIKGRWGAWGIEFPGVIFQSKEGISFLNDYGQNSRLFNVGLELTKVVSASSAKGWLLDKNSSDSDNQGYEVDFTNWGTPIFAKLDKEYLQFSMDKKNIVAKLKEGEWSNWIPINLQYELKEDYQKNSPKKSDFEKKISTVDVPTFVKIKVIYYKSKSEFRVRFIYDALNEYITAPSNLSEQMRNQVGHMVDYVDNYPPQLVYFQEDKKTFIEESNLAWDWHKNSVKFLIDNLKSDFIIHSIYNPNQMLTSRWWLPYIDKHSYKYSEKPAPERAELFKEVKDMYKKADDIFGEIIKNTDDNWYIVISSDHGVIPLNKEVRLNNLFKKMGWLNYKINKKTNELEIDWKNTKVIFLQMTNVYINPKSLDGTYNRSNSPEYFALRRQVTETLKNIKDPSNNQLITDKIWNYEDANQSGLPTNRVGDLIIANVPQYSWSEEITDDLELLSKSYKGGYKQGILPKSAEGMLTPFVIAGPKIKNGCKLKSIVNHADQFATIEKILGITAPYKLDGLPIEEIFK